MAINRSDYGTLDEFLAALGNDSSYQQAQASESTWTPQRNAQYEALQQAVSQGGPGSMGKNVVQQQLPEPVARMNDMPAIDQFYQNMIQQSYNDNVDYTPGQGGDFLVTTNMDGTVSSNQGASFAPMEGAVMRPDLYAAAQEAKKNEEDSNFFANEIDNRIKAIEAEPDLLKREQLLLNLKSDYEAKSSEKLDHIREQVKQKFGLDKLTAEFQRSMALDATMDPSVTKGKPSYETVQLAQQLKVAEAQAKEEMKFALKENPILTASEAKVNNFLKYSDSKLKYDRQQADRKYLEDQRALDKADAKAATQEQKDEAAKFQAGSNGIELAGILDKKLPDDTARAKFFLLRAKEPEVRILADNLNNPEGILRFSAEPTSTKAGQVVAHLQAKAKAGDNEALYDQEYAKADKEMKAFKAAVNTPEGIKKTEEVLYPDIGAAEPSPATKAYIQAKTMAGMEGTAAEKQKAAHELAVSNAQKLLDIKATAEYSSNILSWNPGVVSSMESSPILSPVINGVKGATGESKIDLQTMAGALIKIPDNRARQQAIEEFRKYAYQAADYADSGVYGKAGGRTLTDNVLNGLVTQDAMKSAGYEAPNTLWGNVRKYDAIGSKAVYGALNNYLLQPAIALGALPGEVGNVILNTPLDTLSKQNMFGLAIDNAFKDADAIVRRSE